MSKKENIINCIKASMVRWSGYAGRIDFDRVQRKIVEVNFSGRRKRGRPRRDENGFKEVVNP